MSSLQWQTKKAAIGYLFSQEVDTYVCLFVKHLSVPGEIHVYRSCYTNILNREDAVSHSSFSSCLNCWEQQAIQGQLNGVLLFRSTQHFILCYLRPWSLYFGVYCGQQ
jgi:hypothetical protein